MSHVVRVCVKGGEERAVAGAAFGVTWCESHTNKVTQPLHTITLTPVNSTGSVMWCDVV